MPPENPPHRVAAGSRAHQALEGIRDGRAPQDERGSIKKLIVLGLVARTYSLTPEGVSALECAMPARRRRASVSPEKYDVEALTNEWFAARITPACKGETEGEP